MDRGELYSGLGFILVGLIIFGIGYAFPHSIHKTLYLS